MRKEAQHLIAPNYNIKDKNKKGKHYNLLMVTNDLKDWKEHKLHRVAFMEYLKSLFRSKSGDEIKYTYGPTLERPANIPSHLNLLQIEEDDFKLNFIDEHTKEALESYGNKMAEYYLQFVEN